MLMKRADFIQKSCIFGAEKKILRSFQLDLWTIDHKKPLEPQGIGVVLLLRYIFQKKINFSESCFFEKFISKFTLLFKRL